MRRWGSPQDVLRALDLGQLQGSSAALPVLRAWWHAAAGATLAARVVPVERRGPVLRVALADPRWRQTLPLLRRRLLADAERLFGITTFEIAADAALPRVEAAPRPPRASAASVQPLPPDLASAAQAIHDPRLRAAFVSAAAKLRR